MQQRNITITHIPTAVLSIHPAIKDMPEWADDDPQFEALCRDVYKRGFDYPLKAVGNKVADGRHRLRCARKLKLESVPVEAITEDQVLCIVLQTLVQRRHYTKGALAYMLVPVFDGKRSQEAMAADAGFSRQLIQQALDIHTIFGEDADYKTEVEPRILSGEVGLGAAVAGYAGRTATKGKNKKQTAQLELWDRSLTDFQKRFTAWDKFDIGAKNTLLAKFQTVVEATPTDLVQKLAAKYNSELKRRQKEAK
jgi:ParB-like chromosome segregation protein Spo0J